jgi:Uncharacterized KleE stable inheritance protein
MGIIILLPNVSKAEDRKNNVSKIFPGKLIVRLVWILTVLVWPLLRWILALNVTLQLFRVLIVSLGAGWYLDWALVVHFMVFVTLTYFVSVYRPS